MFNLVLYLLLMTWKIKLNSFHKKSVYAIWQLVYTCTLLNQLKFKSKWSNWNSPKYLNIIPSVVLGILLRCLVGNQHPHSAFYLILRQHLVFEHNGQIAKLWGFNLRNSPRDAVTRPFSFGGRNGYLKF